MQQIWSEDFSASGSRLTDLGFQFAYSYLPNVNDAPNYAQLASASSLQRLTYNKPAATSVQMGWVKDTGKNENWIEADIHAYVAGQVDSSTAYLATGVKLDETGKMVNFGTNAFISSLAGAFYVQDNLTRIATLSLPYLPARVRIENLGETAKIFYGPIGIPKPTTPLGNANGYPTNMNLKGSHSGFVVYSNNGLGNNNIDNVTSGNFSVVRPLDSRSLTFSDTVDPVNLLWSENFNSTAPGTALVDMGFVYETTEPNSDHERAAIVGDTNALTFLSSVNSAEMWVKPTGTENHFIECDLLKYPYDMQFPLIIRAFSPEHFIGIKVTAANIQLVSRYAGTDTMLAHLPKSRFSGLPIRIRIEARHDWVYAMWGPANGNSPGTHFTYVGNALGYFINKNITPALLTSNRAGVARLESTAVTDFADNYRAGVAYIAAATVYDFSHSNNRSPTRADVPVVDGIAYPTIRDARSYTFSDMGRITRENEVYVQPSVSKTYADIGTAKFHGPSIVFPYDAVSRTRSKVGTLNAAWAVNIYRGYSFTRTDLIGTWQGGQAINIRDAKSETFAEEPRLSPEAFVTIDDARSQTFGNAAWAISRIPIQIDDARSETFSDVIDPSDAGNYRPWLFT